MKTFKEYMSEQTMPYQTARGTMDIDDEATRDNINVVLNGATSLTYPNPYIALERVKKVLANWHIFLPRTAFMEHDHGFEIWNIQQFGNRVGMNDQGQFVKNEEGNFFLFFEYGLNDQGTFSVYCEVVNEPELEKLKDAVNSELNADTVSTDTDEPEMAINELTKEKLMKYVRDSAKQATNLQKSKKDPKKLEKRLKGRYTALGKVHKKTWDKMVAVREDQINELSKDKLLAHAKDASHQATRMIIRGEKGKTLDKRIKYHDLAWRKIHRKNKKKVDEMNLSKVPISKNVQNASTWTRKGDSQAKLAMSNAGSKSHKEATKAISPNRGIKR